MIEVSDCRIVMGNGDEVKMKIKGELNGTYLGGNGQLCEIKLNKILKTDLGF